MSRLLFLVQIQFSVKHEDNFTFVKVFKLFEQIVSLSDEKQWITLSKQLVQSGQKARLTPPNTATQHSALWFTQTQIISSGLWKRWEEPKKIMMSFAFFVVCFMVIWLVSLMDDQLK